MYRTAKFVGDVEKITILPGTTMLRFVMTPLTSETFEVLNAWFAPWPKATGSFGVAQS